MWREIGDRVGAYLPPRGRREIRKKNRKREEGKGGGGEEREREGRGGGIESAGDRRSTICLDENERSLTIRPYPSGRPV